MLDFNTVRTLRDEDEYQAALKAIRPYFDNEPNPGTAEAENFDAIFMLIENYEAKHYPIPRAEPVAVIRHIMAANNYSQKDLAAVIGSKARASELLAGKRDINLDQIRKLAAAWRIPVGALVGGIEAA
jgi:HTH-type transcriptional regulator / antitoxin HigA